MHMHEALSGNLWASQVGQFSLLLRQRPRASGNTAHLKAGGEQQQVSCQLCWCRVRAPALLSTRAAPHAAVVCPARVQQRNDPDGAVCCETPQTGGREVTPTVPVTVVVVGSAG
jgi:hypothetical protein